MAGEGLEQRDLPVREGTERQPRDPDRANGAALMQERDGYLAPRAALPCDRSRELDRLLEIRHVDNCAVEDGPAYGEISIGSPRIVALQGVDALTVDIVVSCQVQAFAVIADDHRAIGVTEPEGVHSDGVEDRLGVRR